MVVKKGSKKAKAKKAAPKKKAIVKKKVVKTKKEKPQLPEPRVDNNKEPARAPQRKVLGSKAFAVTKPSQIAADTQESKEQPQVPTTPSVAVSSNVISKPSAKELAPIPKVSWQKLSESIPAQTRFLVSMAENECRAASKWPFPFAKLLSQLPDKLCGQGLALMFLELDFDSQSLLKKIKFSPDFISRLLAQEQTNLIELFSATCPEMYRKLKTQISGPGLSIEALLERYLVANVDRSFQFTIGAVILKALAQ